jgi:hypothetical protein
MKSGLSSDLSPDPRSRRARTRQFAVHPRAGGGTTVLGGNASLRRGKHPRVFAPYTPLCLSIIRDGQLRREPDQQRREDPLSHEISNHEVSISRSEIPSVRRSALPELRI